MHAMRFIVVGVALLVANGLACATIAGARSEEACVDAGGRWYPHLLVCYELTSDREKRCTRGDECEAGVCLVDAHAVEVAYWMDDHGPCEGRCSPTRPAILSCPTFQCVAQEEVQPFTMEMLVSTATAPLTWPRLLQRCVD